MRSCTAAVGIFAGASRRANTASGAYMDFLYNWSVAVLGASRAGTPIYSQMIFAAFFAWLILGERLEWYHFAGGALVIIGILPVTLLRPAPVLAGKAEQAR